MAKKKAKPKEKKVELPPTQDWTPVPPIGAPASPQRVEIKLPVSPDCPAPVPMIVVPVPLEHAKVEPLPEAVGPVRCIATKLHGWTEDYVILAAKDGHKLPPISEDGTEVDVVFSPPVRPLEQEG